MKIRRLTELSLITAAALIVFVIELRLPDLSPIPGIKPGLANIFTVYCVYRYKCGETACVVISRILIGGIFGGNLSALIYSFAGAALATTGMLLLKKIIPMKFMWLTSVFGGIFHNSGQLAAAAAVTGTLTVLSYAPLLITAGMIAGAFTGFCAQFVLARIRR